MHSRGAEAREGAASASTDLVEQRRPSARGQGSKCMARPPPSRTAVAPAARSRSSVVDRLMQ
jgi:hypothetical protein